jgi:hypothetical protein
MEVKMTGHDLEALLKCIVDNNKRGQKWLDTVPSEINSVFFDNPYVDAVQGNFDLLLKTLFKGDIQEEIEWFLYEWDETREEVYRTITYSDGTVAIIGNVEDFVKHLRNQQLVE